MNRAFYWASHSAIREVWSVDKQQLGPCHPTPLRKVFFARTNLRILRFFSSSGQQRVSCSGAGFHTASDPPAYKPLLVIMAEVDDLLLDCVCVFVYNVGKEYLSSLGTLAYNCLPSLGVRRYVFCPIPPADDMLSEWANEALAGPDI
ncbi:hypothetical protein Efla_005845 [Eimeria flavescens]